MMKKYIYFLIFFLSFNILVSAQNKLILKNKHVFPALNSFTVEGKKVDLFKLHPDSFQLLVFCSFKSRDIKLTMDTLIKLKKQVSDKLAINVIGIDQNTKWLHKYKQLEQRGLSFYVDNNREDIKKLQIFILPTLYLVDQNGLLVDIYVDMTNSTQKRLLRDLNKLFGKELTL